MQTKYQSKIIAMFHKLIVAAVFVLLGVNASGQFKNKDWYVSPKISFADYSDRNDWNGYSITKIPPVSLGVEKGVTDFLSVGGLLGYSRDKYVNDTLSTNIHRYADFALGGTANVHFAGWIEEWTNYSVFLGDWDLYVGLSALMRWHNTKEEDVWNEDLEEFNNHSSKEFAVKVRPMVGVRYFVNDNFCMMIEVGHGNMGLVTTGLTFRIPNQDY